MAGSRKWRAWPKNFATKVESTSGMFGLVGGAGAVAGTFASLPVATLVGGTIVVGAIIHAAWCSFPGKSLSVSEALGRKLSLAELDSLDECLLKLAVVGASQSGKSTFLNSVQHLSQSSSRTNTVQAEILMLPGHPPKYIALLDADGKEYVQQFEILKAADFFIIFVDHNISSTDGLKKVERLAEHDRFLEQVEPLLRGRSIRKIHLLLNKRDLWEKGQDSVELTEWFERHVQEWGRMKIANEVTFSVHSNKDTQDMAKMMEFIRGFLSGRIAP